MAFSVEFESDILATAFRDENFLKRASRICDAHHFATKEHAWVWTQITETWSKYSERTTGTILAARAKHEFPEAEKRRPYLELGAELLRRKVISPASALEQLGTFVREVNLQLVLEQSMGALDKGDLDAAESAIDTASSKRALEREYTHVKWIEEFEDRQERRKYEKEHPDEIKAIPTGIKKLDRILGGGVRVGELALAMGTTGRGKSVMLTNLAHNAAARGIPTCYFALEMPARQIAARQDSRTFGIEYDKFKGYDFRPSELREIQTKLSRAKKQFGEKLHIISMPVRTATLASVKGAIDDLYDEYRFRPELLLVDSGDHLLCKDKSLDSFRLQQASVYWGLKALGEDEGYAVWSSTHAGKEWAHQVATAEATSEAYDKARIADIIFTLNDLNAKPSRSRAVDISTDEEEEDEEEEIFGVSDDFKKVRQLEGYLAKYRDGASMVKIELEAHFSKMLMKERASEADEDDE